MNAIATAGVYIAEGVALDAIWNPNIAEGEHLAVRQSRAIFGDIELVDTAREARVDCYLLAVRWGTVG